MAIKLVMDAQGVIRSKELLFATDERLGQRVLEKVDRWMRSPSCGGDDANGRFSIGYDAVHLDSACNAAHARIGPPS